MSYFHAALEQVLRHEGGFSDNPNDPGGATRYGITQAVARRYGYDGDMRNLPLDEAKSIYRDRYWLPEFDGFPHALAINVFDGAVNSGVRQSVRWLQQAVGVADDGIPGPVTRAALADNDTSEIVARYNGQRLEFLTRLSTWREFGKGWARRIADNLRIT